MRIDKKDKALDLKLVKFRPEKWGLCSKEMVEDDLQATRKAMHDKVRQLEMLVQDLRAVVHASMDSHRDRIDSMEQEIQRASQACSEQFDRD